MPKCKIRTFIVGHQAKLTGRYEYKTLFPLEIFKLSCTYRAESTVLEEQGRSKQYIYPLQPFCGDFSSTEGWANYN